jgi:hypothetical protein
MRASPSQRAKPTAVIGGASERPRWTVVTERADEWRVRDGGATLKSASECVGGKGCARGLGNRKEGGGIDEGDNHHAPLSCDGK